MKKLFTSALLALALFAPGLNAADYGLPSKIEQGNILHCFNWPINTVKSELPNIAAAGFATVQLSPLQRPDIKTGYAWHDLYRPYDLAFKESSGMGSRADLQALCSEAAKYGIKVIVDVVANHVDKTSGYHDSWWDQNNRVRSSGPANINYSDRYSITHDRLGDYCEINSEHSDVIARGKAYVEDLKSMGVAGCRWDAAKHIATPSENCGFWSAVTSVPGMWHYGEILNDDGTPWQEYQNYMYITDNRYSNSAAHDNGGLPQGFKGSWGSSKVVWWGESHDTYANDEWSQNVDQSVIDRAYAAYACRNEAVALYLARPNAKGFNNIKVGKGTDAYKSKHIAEVNKFRNAMVGKADYFTNNGNAVSITRQGGGAVIVMKGSGNVSIANGGGYCPAGTYTDHVSGGTFTVTSSTISGNVGSSGIAVLYNGIDTPTPPTPPTPGDLTITGDYNLAYSGDKTHVYYWGGSEKADWPGQQMATATGSDGNTYKVFKVPTGTKNVIFNNGGSSQTDDLDYSGEYVMGDNGATTTKVTFNGGDQPTPPTPGGDHYVYYDGTFSNPAVWAWTDSSNCTSKGSWPGDNMTKKDGKWYWEVPSGKDVPTMIIISENGGDKIGGKDLQYVDKATYHQDGTYTQDQPTPTKPVVTANPASTSFTDDVTVTLSATPAGSKIYYTDNGATPTTSSTEYVTSFTLTKTTTIKAFAVASDGTQGDVATFTYTKGDTPTPPTPPTPGNNLITDYYKVNHLGFGTERTVNISGHPASSALTNWSPSDMIAQGVARDVAQAFKGLHERPIVDSYAIYASYDNDNLYLGVQFVYTVWDAGGEGKQPGESKPYNMDGHMIWAFDLDPNKSFDGYINGTGPIWNDTQKGAKFNNGVDHVLMLSTKPQVNNFTFFKPTADGHASYDAEYCIAKPAGVAYGYTDGLLSSIDKIWGQPLGGDPEALKGNTGFVDLKGEIAESAHTFYEFKIPLSLLGITKDYIKNTGIGVMYIDKYGTSPVGGTPYDPSYFDNVKDEYSYGDNTSAEKEDEDIITYSPARVGKGGTSGINGIGGDNAADMNAPVEYFNLQGVRVNTIEEPGIYIKRQGKKAEKVIVK